MHDDPASTAILARALRLPTDGGRGARAVPAIDIDAPAGSLVVVHGPARSGRTALLLAIGGRMRPTGGSLRVLGRDLPRGGHAVRRRSAIAVGADIVPFDGSLTVRHHIVEAVTLAAPAVRPWARRREIAAVHERAGGIIGEQAETVLPLHTRLDRLAPLPTAALGVALALAGDPDLLLVDDVDALRDVDDRRALWRGLLQIAGAPTASGRPRTVVATCERLHELDGLVEVDDLAGFDRLAGFDAGPGRRRPHQDDAGGPPRVVVVPLGGTPVIAASDPILTESR